LIAFFVFCFLCSYLLQIFGLAAGGVSS